MRRFLLSVYRLVSLCCVLSAAAACNATKSQQPAVGLSGTYSLTWERTAAVCSPTALPAATSADTTLYASVPTQSHSMHLSAVVVHTGSQVVLTPATASGTPIESLTLTGPFIPLNVYFARASARTEGPRAGARMFVASESAADTAAFSLQVQTVPGQGTASSFTGSGTTTVVFRDAATGATYTTCTFKETLSGVRN